MRTAYAEPTTREPGTALGRSLSPAVVGGLGSAGLMILYVGIVAGASGSLDHLRSQAIADWYFLVPLMTGFGIQIGLFSELRRRRRLHAVAAGAGAAGAGASTAGMVACCAHHVAELAPFLGASAAATFLTAYKVPFILVGLAVNAGGIIVGVRNLGRIPATTETDACAAH